LPEKNFSRIESLIYNFVTHMPIAGQRVPKHIPAEANTRNNRTSTVKQRLQYAFNNRITPVAMQRVVNTTIKEAIFSIWLAYIHCWATDVFSVGPPRDYISNPVVNQESVVEREQEWSEISAVKEEGFG
jgi:hypothetical protein